jgi:hypothetical protein
MASAYQTSWSATMDTSAGTRQPSGVDGSEHAESRVEVRDHQGARQGAPREEQVDRSAPVGTE